MMKNKKSLISEIVRINQIILDRKIISEAVTNPIIDLVNQLVKMGTKSSTVRVLQDQLKTKGITLTKKIEIINKLRSSNDKSIRDLILSFDNKVTLEILRSIPNITRNPKTIATIQKLASKGLTKDDIIDQLASTFKKNYGVYSDDLIDDFVNELDNSFDEIINSTPPSVVDDASSVVDDASPNISREISDISPLFTRYRGDYLKKGEIISNKLRELIETRNTPNLDGEQILSLDKQIKENFDKLRNLNKDYVDAIEVEIENGMNTRGPDREKWGRINSILSKIKEKKGDWGVVEITTPNSGRWLVFKEAWIAATNFERTISGILSGTQFWKSFSKAIKIISNKGKIDADEISTNITKNAKVGLFQSGIFPGSPRGLPFQLKSLNGKTLPNAYEEILKQSKKYPKYNAYFSLVLEKLILVAKIQVYTAVITGLIDWIKFESTNRKEIMQKYGDCVFEIAESMKNGQLSLEDSTQLNLESIPKCLRNLLQSGIDDNTLSQILIRADFFSRGTGGTEYLGFFTRDLFELSLPEAISRFLTGPLANIVISGLFEYIPMVYQAEKTGDETPLQNELRRLQQQSREIGVNPSNGNPSSPTNPITRF